MQLKSALLSAAGFACLAFLTVSAEATQIGTISACYACQNTGDPVIDAALTANPGVAGDGILFAFKNTGGSAITGGVFSLSGTSPADSFILPTIAVGGEFILMPGITTDGGAHPAGGFFAATGVMDTSDGSGGVTDSSIFSFTGTAGLLAVTSTTAGSSTAIAGTFTPGDPGLTLPWRSPAGGSTTFVGLGPSGDGGCNNCYYGVVATLNTPSQSATPEPQSFALMLGGLALTGWSVRRRIER